ncbi:Na(+)-translocating NADH-quinone reductase subunit F [Subsaximicrobium wynnwilliamsii]|uniref:Na(+)-translocating NADH-quinone reductase subunit F n=1 Tax=Subsaximicrobium wynnwilliamsii TaxID=291179 RepID=A0A5C6ZM15_9FLAO|nr:Na(+)-translocating NADH-quinone reductase subunit F [Subsaximicrobium wynnwilliamsii]TXD84619.1 Na(+)-translocating NADH-quinone reductase subunit F [Subsaximicrobium wynnwilliamsii]TXD90301.1 Na(+)-translocating NADH-quinone reductase subunit F [Subsaximicrobium wynnwilliamsii]TXE04352.1 Na(+)-translocating NADH-quinone reductase subunit F [Subsaximicrobium wynnwilliamsii]
MSNRLEKAIEKLYVAFHNNTLHPECCKSCAVGNILDNKDSWKHLSDDHGSLQLNYLGKVHQGLGRRFNGYTPQELLQVEASFLAACDYELPFRHNHKKPKNPTDKDLLFKGLCAVISFLCKLDHVPNVMDYTKLFEVENDKPKFALALA